MHLKPIETAPRDREILIAWVHPGFGVDTVARGHWHRLRRTWEYTVYNEDCFIPIESSADWPTHWCKLPEVE